MAKYTVIVAKNKKTNKKKTALTSPLAITFFFLLTGFVNRLNHE